MVPRREEYLLTLSSIGWLMAFFAIPVFITLALAFRESDPRGGVGDAWTLDFVRQLADSNYAKLFIRTLAISLIVTTACFAIALPVAWFMARCRPRWRHVILMLVILPFLSNFIIRIFAWKSLLHPEGAMKHLLVWLRLAGDDVLLLNNPAAVVVVMIYTQLPFAILPLFAAAEKFDFQLLDAARDLGAGPCQSFWRVFVPGIRQGVISSLLMVFVCSLGQYVIPQLVGGAGDELVGNKIVQRAFTDRNLPLACALAGALLLFVLGICGAGRLWGRGRSAQASIQDRIF